MTAAERVYQRVVEVDDLAARVRQVADELDSDLQTRGSDAVHGKLNALATEVQQLADRLFVTVEQVLGPNAARELRRLDEAVAA